MNSEHFLTRSSQSVSHALVFTDSPATENIRINIHFIILINNYLYTYFFQTS